MGKRILVLTPQFPYPPHQGTTMRNYNIIMQLAQRHEVHLLSFVEGNGNADPGPLAGRCQSIHGSPTPRRTVLQRLFATFLSPWPDMALRLPSEKFRERLVATLEEQPFDIVQVEGIEMAQYGLQVAAWRARRPAPLVVFEDHNAEYVLQQRAFETDVRRPRRWPAALYSLIQWRKLRRYEAQVCRVADRVIAVSEADKAALQRLVGEMPVTVVPNGIDLEFYQTLPQGLPALACASRPGEPGGGSLALVFTGKMDFRPNVDAVLWFGQEVLPLICRELPEAHFYVVGQRPHSRLAALKNNPAVTITGAVPDVRPYISGAAVYVVPLRIGGGTRFKILEAMALGRPIVSTSLGCEGFPELRDGESILIADTPEAFASQTVRLLRDPDARARLGEAAGQIAPAYDWQAIVPRLESAYDL
jgi:glycosyltransferase involved in cell wall biosynthesis